MNPLHEYEAWLDTVDARFKISGQSIVYSFDKTHEFPIKALQSKNEIIKQAEIMKALVLKNSECLPLEYMCKRLIMLSREASDLEINIDQVLNELKIKWTGFNK